MAKKRSVTSAVVLQVLAWLGRTPESFLSGGDVTSKANEQLPETGPARVLRLDTRAVYESLDAERVRRGMNWKRVADEMPGFTENMLKNLSSGPLIGFPRVMFLAQWLGCPLTSFVRVRSR
jgi:hypothetical protein